MKEDDRMQSAKDDNLIGASAADRLIAAHDGDVALLYLYIRRSGSADTEGAARALCRTLGEMEAALEKLGRMGLLGDEAAAKPAGQDRFPPADEMPQYSAADIVSRDDKAFSAVLLEAQRVLGHALSTPDLKKLFGIYDYLRLPAEVIMLLLHHCVTLSNGRLPSRRFIEKEAFVWADNEIRTAEQAEAYCSASRGGSSPPPRSATSPPGWTSATRPSSSPSPTTAPSRTPARSNGAT